MSEYPIDQNTVIPFAWNDEFCTGIKSIDEQHKKLVSIIKVLYNAIADGKASDVMDTIFSDLFDYSEQHFSYEEELFKWHDYPDSEDHKNEHAELKRQLIKLKNKLHSQDNFMCEVLLLKFLEEWLINHILKTDKKFVPYLIDKGVL
jgi:hemerythrin-like metal-binding protein